MAGQGRSVELWNALAPSTRRRWIAAYGSEDAALEAYRNGASLTREQRGHGFTPERPSRALANPQLYPRYVATHTDQLNEIARRRGMKEHGLGQRGDAVTDYEKAGGDFTWVVPQGAVDDGDWRFSQVFRTAEEAQLYARQSWAPAGVVIIVDLGPAHIWRYEVWFGYPESRRRSRGPRKGGRAKDPAATRDYNRRKRDEIYSRHA